MLETILFHLAFRLFLRRSILTATTFFGIIGVVSPQLVQGTPILEDFEEQAVGQFPVGWTDVGEVDASLPNPPDPSAVVIDTTDAFGSPTQALQFLEAAASSPGFSQGIFQSVDPGSIYQMKMHTRIDQFNNNPDRRYPGATSPLLPASFSPAAM